MRRTHVILIALILAVPVAAANWSYRGSNEPDTAWDDATLMYADPDTSGNQGIHKIYFNAFARVARETHYNPNVGALGTRMQPAVTATSAVLGFWKDCNNDGYVGMPETALLEYRAELLLDTSICPVTTPVPGQTVYPHNDGTWVREMIWIGPGKGAVGAPSQNPTNFYADDTAVWGDWGVPGALPTLVCPGGNVGIRSTGAILDNADCGNYYRGVRTLNQVQDATGAPTGGWDARDVDNSDATLNIDNPAYPFLYGPAEPEGHPQEGDYRGYSGGFLGKDTSSENRRTRMVTIVDCDTKSADTSPEVNTPGDPLDPATYPSLYESLNDTFEVATQSGSNDPCSPSGPADEGLPYPAVEGYTEPTFADAGRVEVDHPFEFAPGSRNTLDNNGGACKKTATVERYERHPVLGYCAVLDLGTAAERDDGPINAAWRTNAQINTYTMTTREGMKNDQADFGAFYMTFYARIGSAALAIGTTPGGGGVYGSEACGPNTTGVHNGWNCDPDAWVARCNDPTLPTLPGQCYRMGFTYNLRDVDCWDNTVVRGVGVHASLVDVSNTGPCVGHSGNEQIDTTIV